MVNNCFKCPACREYKDLYMAQLHHKFPQRTWAKKLYGSLIHDERNISKVCADCHVGHRSMALEHWDEAKFCSVLGIEPRSKASKKGWL